MTIEEFSKQVFNNDMVCIYKKSEYKIVSVNFYEHLVALECGKDDEFWVRCENITML